MTDFSFKLGARATLLSIETNMQCREGGRGKRKTVQQTVLIESIVAQNGSSSKNVPTEESPWKRLLSNYGRFYLI